MYFTKVLQRRIIERHDVCNYMWGSVLAYAGVCIFNKLMPHTANNNIFTKLLNNFISQYPESSVCANTLAIVQRREDFRKQLIGPLS
jgi:hypothetical protein